MRIVPTFLCSARATRGFSLVELSVVIAIIGVVATFGLEMAANSVNRTATNVSRERMLIIDEAIAQFFKIYGRLPCPALKTLAPTNTAYGQEDCSIAVLTSTTVGGGVMAGAVPFRSLNLPMMFSIDGFYNKLNYVVTKNLTMSGTSYTGQFGYMAGTTSTNGVAGIEVRTGILEQPCTTSKCQVLANPSTNTGAAYLVFTSGADQRGAVSDRGANRQSCATATDYRVDTQNCVFGANAVRTSMAVTAIPYNVFYDNRYNAGLNLSSYFDDVVVWRGKAQL